MFEQTFKNLDDVLWKEAGCSSELDYTEQSSWLLFLKYLDDLEIDHADEAEMEGIDYQYIIEAQYRWSCWAVPKDENGAPDRDNALTGKDLIRFVDTELFPYLQSFRSSLISPDTIEYKIGEIFSEIKNKFQNGYALRDALDLVDQLTFGTREEKHELSELYETNQRIAKIVCDEQLVDQVYFLHFLRSRTFLDSLYAIARGVRQANLSVVNMKKLQIVLPSKVTQIEISCVIEKLSTEVSRLEKNYQSKLVALTELKQSLLQKAFTGELTADWHKQHPQADTLYLTQEQ